MYLVCEYNPPGNVDGEFSYVPFIPYLLRFALNQSTVKMLSLKHLWLYVCKKLHAVVCRFISLTLDTSGCIDFYRVSSVKVNVICEP
jgi:hypothetical protein